MNKLIIDELRSATTPAALDEAAGTLRGIVIPYNSIADLGYGVSEVMKPGCVAELLRSKPKVAAIMEHAPISFLGCTTDGTLRLIDGDDALRYEIDLPDTTYAKDLRSAMKANPNAFGASWHMRVPADGYELQFGDDGSVLRSITTIAAMREVTITAFPVYTDTTAMLRSVKELRDEHERLRTADMETRKRQLALRLRM